MATTFQKRNESAQAHLPRSGHSLSHRYAFTAAAGQLITTFWDYASPGDKYSIKTDFDLSRALPLLQPATLDIEVCTDYFFVPMDLMFMPFGELYSGTQNLFSTNFRFDQQSPDLPFMRLWTDGFLLNRFQKGFSFFDGYGKSIFRMLDMMGDLPLLVSPRNQRTPAEARMGITDTFNSSPRPNRTDGSIWPYLAYQAIYQYFYRDEEHEVFNPATFNIDSVDWNTGIGNTLLQGTDALNIDPYATRYMVLRYVNRKADYFTDIQKSALINVTNLGRDLAAFGGDDFGLKNWLTKTTSADVAPYSVRSDGDVRENNTATSVGYDARNIGLDIDTVLDNGASLSALLNTAGLRALFANEKLLRVTAAAKKNYDDQTLAHFGVKVPHDVKHQITHFGHNIMKYQVSEVVSTAQTEQGVLGEQAGRLYGANKNDSFETFTAPVHGVVMAITFVRPSYSYIVPQHRINKYTSIGDWWRPEYDHIGMQPIFRQEVQFNAFDSNQYQNCNDVVGWQYRWSELKRRFNRASYAFADGTYSSYLVVSSPWSHIFNGKIVDRVPVNFDWLNNNTAVFFKVSPHDTDMIFGAAYNELWTVSEQRWSDIVGDLQSASEVEKWIGRDYMQEYEIQDGNDAVGVFTGTLDLDGHPEQVYSTDPFVLQADIRCNKVSFMSENSLPKMDM